MKKILVWLSGWVDSAVAAYLLKEQWYEVVAGFMKNYIDEENPNCSTYQDAKEAIKVADFLWIEIISFDLRQEYEDKIIKYIYDGYQKWITPNPDVLCNSLIKFDVFLEKALELWFDWIAMWHYARIMNSWNSIPLIKGDLGGSKYIKYNPTLKEKARELRNNATNAEKKLRYNFLSTCEYKFLRQKPIDEYIVDFFCNKLNLIIEIDWDTHRSNKEITYDKKRTKKLESLWLKVIRFTNTEVYENFEEIIKIIEKYQPPLSPSQSGTETKYKLLRWVDYNKDQSYFLSGLNQYQLSKALFPIGEMTKEKVRELAKKIWLPNADRKDSQWLCFIGKVPMKDFLKKRLPIKKWDIVLLDGTKVWEHEWAYFFTIWQSRGLDINKKAYVVRIDVKKNLIFVSYEKFEPELVSKEIKVSNWHWIDKEYNLPLECSTKIRYRQEPQEATLLESKVKSLPAGRQGWKLKVIYEEKQWGIAPGQTLTAYIGDECIGSGIIEWV